MTGTAIALPLFASAGASAADATTWDHVAECETGGMWSANLHNGSFGGLQLTQDTWDSFGGRQYASRPDLASRSQQIAVAEKVLEAQGTTAWAGCADIAGLAHDHTAPDVDPGIPLPSAPAGSDATGHAPHAHQGSGKHHTGAHGHAGSSSTAHGAPGVTQDASGAPTAGNPFGAPASDAPSTQPSGLLGGLVQDNPVSVSQDNRGGLLGSLGLGAVGGDGVGDDTPGGVVPVSPGDGTTQTPSGGATSTPGAPGTDASTPGTPAPSTTPSTPEPTGSADATPASGTQDGTPGGDSPSPATSGKHRGAAADESSGDAPATGATSGTDTSAQTGKHTQAPDDASDDASDAAATSGTDDAGDSGTYTVQQGDSLSGIAATQGLTGGWRQLYDANKSALGADPDHILPGQSLLLGRH